MMNIDPRSVELPRPPPRVVQVCACGAVLVRGMYRARPIYFWTYLDGRSDGERRAFRTEDKAGIHCGAEDCFRRERLTCIGFPRGWAQHWFLHGRCVLCGTRPEEVAHAS